LYDFTTGCLVDLIPRINNKVLQDTKMSGAYMGKILFADLSTEDAQQ
jgi:hypothetical protein